MAVVGCRYKISGVSGEWWWAGTGPWTFIPGGSGVGQDLGDAGAPTTYVTTAYKDEVTGLFGANGPLSKAAPEPTHRPVPHDPTAPPGSEANPLRASTESP